MASAELSVTLDFIHTKPELSKPFSRVCIIVRVISRRDPFIPRFIFTYHDEHCDFVANDFYS